MLSTPCWITTDESCDGSAERNSVFAPPAPRASLAAAKTLFRWAGEILAGSCQVVDILTPARDPAIGIRMTRMSPSAIAAAQQAAVELRLERDALLAGVAAPVVASIPMRSTLAAQILTDLHELNSIGALADGSDPLRIWFINASALSRDRQSSMIFLTCLRAIGFGPESGTAADVDHDRSEALAALAIKVAHSVSDGVDTKESRSSIYELRRLKSLFSRLVYLNVEQTGLTTNIRRAMPIDESAWDHWVRPTIESALEEANGILSLLVDIAHHGDDLPVREQKLYRRLVSSMRERVSFYSMFLSFRFGPDAESGVAAIIRESLCDIDSQYRRLVNELHDLGDALEDLIRQRDEQPWGLAWDTARLRLANSTGDRFYHERPAHFDQERDAKAVFEEAEKRFENGDYAGALPLYEEVDGYVPGLTSRFRAACCLDRLGRRWEAVEAYSEYIGRHPNPTVGSEYLAVARGRLEELSRSRR